MRKMTEGKHLQIQAEKVLFEHPHFPVRPKILNISCSLSQDVTVFQFTVNSIVFLHRMPDYFRQDRFHCLVTAWLFIQQHDNGGIQQHFMLNYFLLPNC